MTEAIVDDGAVLRELAQRDRQRRQQHPRPTRVRPTKDEDPLSDTLRQWQSVLAHSMDRDDVIAAIKAALKRRSDRPWSVIGGKGTAWGWITVVCPPRRSMHRYGHWMTDADIAELCRVFGVNNVHPQGISIPDSHDYRRVWLCRALYGHSGPFTAEPYWD